MRRATTQTFYPYKPDGSHYTGDVTVYGGLYKNGVFVENSKIEGQKPDRGVGGSFTITMDSTEFGNIDLNDNFRFGYEVIFEDEYAPQVIWVDGYTNNRDNIRLGDTILRLKPISGSVFTVTDYLYENDSEIINVTNNNSFVGISDEYPTGILSAHLVGTNVGNLKYVDEFGYEPPAPLQSYSILYSGLDFMSGRYTYYSLELNIDENLPLGSDGKQRAGSYFISANDNNGNIQKSELPFEIASSIGVSVFDESELGFDLTNFIIPLDDVPIDPTEHLKNTLAKLMGDSITDFVSYLIKHLTFKPNTDINIPAGIHFDIQIKQKYDGNPLVYEVRGVYRNNNKDDDRTVWWAVNNEGTGSGKIHYRLGCPGLNNAGLIDSGSIVKAQRKGVLGGGCKHCANELNDEFEKEFNNTKSNYIAYKNKTKYSTPKNSRFSGPSNNAKMTAYIQFDIGYDINLKEAFLELTELGIATEWEILSYDYSLRVPINFIPILPIVFTIEFSADLGLEVEFKILPQLGISLGKGMEGKTYSRSDMDFLTLEAALKADLRLRGGIGLDAWLAAATVGAFGEVKGAIEFVYAILQNKASLRATAETKVGIDLQWRIGAPIHGLISGKPYFKSGTTELWVLDNFSKKFYLSLSDNQHLFCECKICGCGDKCDGTECCDEYNKVFPKAAMQLALFNMFIEQRLHEIPEPQFPMTNPVLAGDEKFAAITWVSMDVIEDELEDFSLFDDFDFSKPLYEWDESEQILFEKLMQKTVDLTRYCLKTII